MLDYLRLRNTLKILNKCSLRCEKEKEKANELDS